MSHLDDIQAFCLANTYGFMPPLPVYPARIRRTCAGKFEPHNAPTAEERTITLAHYSGGSNILIKFKPSGLTY